MNFLYNNFLSDFFVILLRWVAGLCGGNYAIGIIILTILLRLALLPLDMNQRNNQEKMAALGPEIQSLQKRYANDPVKLQRKQQELYREMNVKPMMGCLPMLIQLPILFAFFGAMSVLASEQIAGIMLNAAQFGPQNVELPQFLWIHNFWQPDSGFAPILPSSSDFLQFLQRNATYITPQAMDMLRSQGILSYANDVVSVNADLYKDLVRQIIEANGVNYIANDAGQMIAQYNNGWFVLPALAGLAQFMQMKFAPANATTQMAEAANPEAAQAQGCSTKMMTWFFPLFTVYICMSSNSAFALYWFTTAIYGFLQMRIITAVKRKAANKVVPAEQATLAQRLRRDAHGK